MLENVTLFYVYVISIVNLNAKINVNIFYGCTVIKTRWQNDDA